MSENKTATDDEELNPQRYHGEEQTVGTVEEMMANFKKNGSQ